MQFYYSSHTPHCVVTVFLLSAFFRPVHPDIRLAILELHTNHKYFIDPRHIGSTIHL